MTIREILEDMLMEYLRGKGGSTVIGEAEAQLESLFEKSHSTICSECNLPATAYHYGEKKYYCESHWPK